MTDLSDLISRVRKAEGPDRELDRAIMVAAFGVGVRNALPLPCFTRSIDDITSLIEGKLPRWHVYSTTVGEQNMPQACLTEPDGACRDFVAHHVSEALARTEALLLSLQEISK